MIRVENPAIEIAAACRQASRGNLMFRVTTESEDLVLKLYRGRRTWFEDATINPLTAWAEQKRGTGPGARYKTESQCLALWAKNGFDVFRTFDRPMPPGVRARGIWMEFLEGHTLVDRLRDETVGWPEKRAQIQRLASELGRRHIAALEQDEILLVQSHPSGKHAFLSGERMVFFDLEGGFRSGFPVGEGLTQEIAGYLRSILKPVPEHQDDALQAFIGGYPSRRLLGDLAAWGIRGRAPYRIFKRFQDERRRATYSKTSVLRLLEAQLLRDGEGDIRRPPEPTRSPPDRGSLSG